MRSLVLHWLLNAAALWVAAWLLPGLDFQGTLLQLLLVAAVFGIVNSLLRPILTVLTCPLIVVTLGLFTLVLNACMPWRCWPSGREARPISARRCARRRSARRCFAAIRPIPGRPIT